MAARVGARSGCGHAGSCLPLEVELHRGKRAALDTHWRRAGSGTVFWPACVREKGASCSGIRNVTWPEVRVSTPATPLHPPAATKDPQPPFSVIGSQIQQLIQCMWAILQVVSRPPSSADFDHVAQRLEDPHRSELPRTLPDTNHMQCGSSSHPHSGWRRGTSDCFRMCPSAARRLALSLSPTPGSTAAGVSEALPVGKVCPGLDVQLAADHTGGVQRGARRARTPKRWDK